MSPRLSLPPTLLLLAGLVVASTARADPPAGLSPMAEDLWWMAERAEEEGALERAAGGYAQVLRVTERPEASIALARVHEAAGEIEAAERVLREADERDRDVGIALAGLLLRDDRADAARRVMPRLRRWSTDREVVWLRAAIEAERDPVRAAALAEDWLGYAVNAPLPVEDALALAERLYPALREAREDELAVRFLDATSTAVPEAAEALQPLRERAVVERLARQLARAQAEPIDAEGREKLQRARAAWEAGEAAEAAAMLDAVVVMGPRDPAVRGLRARVLEDLGRVGEAEVELRVAESLDPLDPRWPEALGDLLVEAYAGRFDADAVEAWDRALGLDPRRPELWLRKARAELRLAAAGERPPSAARISLQRVISLDPEGPLGTEAARLQAALARSRPEAPEVPRGTSCPDGVSQSACEAYYLALAYQRWTPPPGSEADPLSLALEQASRARDAAPEWVAPLNLQAVLLRRRGEARGIDGGRDRAESERLYQRSLELDPEQPAIWVHLGTVRERDGDRAGARQAWERAVSLPGSGGAPAHLYLGEDALEHWQIWEARAHLEAYRQTPGSPRLEPRAAALDRGVRTVEQGALIAAGGAVMVLFGVPAVWLWRRSRGKSVQDLLDRDPGSWREVARIASALRHEVLKHHTSVLPAVADALEAGDTELAAWLGERLADPDGPVASGRAWIARLEELGKRAGVPLDLERRDEVFGPVITGLERLARCQRGLSRGARRLAPELRAVAELLHEQAYPALGALVQRISVLHLEARHVEEAWSSVRREPAFREVELPPLQVEVPDGLHVRIWRDELDLVLVNLLRNAAEATLEHAGDDARLGVCVAVEEDPITFLERVAIRVRDDAPRRVSTAMIRGRYIERGLGLTVDVISRNAGSIHVEDEAGWSKAVVVRLPRVEVAPPDPQDSQETPWTS